MKIEDLMTRRVSACRPTDMLSDAAQLMRERDCGCVPVVSEDGSRRVVGMLTDRDICLALYLRGAAPATVRVRDAMSREVRSIEPSATAAEAEALMREARVRRLPVVDGDQSLVGLVSLADLARASLRERASGRQGVRGVDLGKTLEVICTDGAPARSDASR